MEVEGRLQAEILKLKSEAEILQSKNKDLNEELFHLEAHSGAVQSELDSMNNSKDSGASGKQLDDQARNSMKNQITRLEAIVARCGLSEILKILRRHCNPDPILQAYKGAPGSQGGYAE